MNQPPPGYGVASDNYPGAGQKGGTVPGGPPEQLQQFENSGFTQIAADGQPGAAGNPPGVFDPMIPSTYQMPMGQPSFGQPVGVGSPPYPAMQPLPPMMHGAGTARPKKKRALPVILLVGGGLAALVAVVVGAGVFLFSRSSSSSEATDPPAITFAPVATVEPEYVAPAQTSEMPAYVPPEPPVTPPPTTTAKPKPKPTATASASASTPPTATASSTRSPISILRPGGKFPGSILKTPQSSGNADSRGSSTAGSAGSSGSTSPGRGSPINPPVGTK